MIDRDIDKEPVAKTPAGTVLLAHWRAARVARDFHVRRAGWKNNIEAAFAGHKMQWLKEILRDVDRDANGA